MIGLAPPQFGVYTKLVVKPPPEPVPKKHIISPLAYIDYLCCQNGMNDLGYVYGLFANYLTTTPEGKDLATHMGIQRSPTQKNIAFLGHEEGFFLTDTEYDFWDESRMKMIGSPTLRERFLKALYEGDGPPTAFDTLQELFRPRGLLKISLKWDDPTSAKKRLVLDKVTFDANA